MTIMPRGYIRKTTRQNWSEDAMLKALDAVKEGMPFKTASKQFSVPVMTLKRRIKGKNKFAVGAVKLLGSKQTVFTPDQERELVQHIKDMESRMYGLTKHDILSLAYQLAVKNNIRHTFSAQKEKAGVDWLKGFRKRNPDITLRTPESTSAARARAFNKPVVDIFFTILKDIQEKHFIPPHIIFNVDETSLCTVPTKNTKVFAQTGRKQVARVTSAERGDTTTVVICCSASGSFIPPMFIFRRIRMKIELMDGAPPGSVYACNTTGWMKLEVFDQWFDHFLAHSKPSVDDPALLILDGHLSHTKNLNVVLKARENHVLILCLPPHCTHKLQPLDVGVMYPLSVYHNQALEKWMNNNPGRVVTVFQIARIFAEAYLKSAVPLNAINGFSKCGIYPLNQDIFSDLDYVAAETTEMPVDYQYEDSTESVSILLQTEPVKTMQVSATIQESINMGPMSYSQELIHMETDESPAMPPNERATPTSEQVHNDVTPPLSYKPPSDQDSDLLSNPISSTITMQSQEVLPFTTPIISHEPINTTSSSVSLIDLPSTSFEVCAPRDIQPLPKIDGKRSNRQRKKVDTSILTSTPYKNYLEEEMKKKILKEEKQTTRKENKAKKYVSYKKTKGKGVGKGKNKKQGVNKGEDKNQRVGKGKKKQKKNQSESSADEDDTECMFCTEPFSRDNMGEGWVLCVRCSKWGHEACAGIQSDDCDDFTCDFCLTDRCSNTKKQLEF